MKLKQKLRSAQGETLVETLAAILVIALVSAALAAGLSAAARMGRTAMNQDAALCEAVSAAERQLPGTGTPGTIRVTVDGRTKDVPVAFYGKDGICSYRAETGEGGGG